MAYNKKGYYIRAKKIQEFTARYYEPERQDRCYKAVWRRWARAEFGFGYRAFLRYLKAAPPPEAPQANEKQLSLFDFPE